VVEGGGGRRGVFLDRDGVLNALVPHPESKRAESPLSVQEVRLEPDAANGVRRLHEAGYLLACVTNQPSAAKGTVSVEAVLAIQRKVESLLAEKGAHIDAWRICLHHPEGIVPPLAIRCECRKPAPGMLISAADELGIDLRGSWIVGDSDLDVLAGRSAGCKTVLVEHHPSAHRRSSAAEPDLRAASLSEAVVAILGAERAGTTS
jgi:D-glycero-D-manno-heptose 1,7-bisphosphate phosphatase